MLRLRDPLRRAPAFRDRAPHFVAMGKRFDAAGVLGEALEQPRQIGEAFGDHMDDAVFVLQLAGDGEEAGTEHDRTESFENLWPHDGVGDGGLIFQRHEDDAVGAAGPLAYQHQARNGDGPPLGVVASRSWGRMPRRSSSPRRNETGCALSDRCR